MHSKSDSKEIKIYDKADEGNKKVFEQVCYRYQSWA